MWSWWFDENGLIKTLQQKCERRRYGSYASFFQIWCFLQQECLDYANIMCQYLWKCSFQKLLLASMKKCLMKADGGVWICDLFFPLQENKVSYPLLVEVMAKISVNEITSNIDNFSFTFWWICFSDIHIPVKVMRMLPQISKSYV